MTFPFYAIDLTHPLSSRTPNWDIGCGFKCSNTTNYDDCSSDVKFRIQHLNLRAGIGTHIDSPSHCFDGAKTVDKLSLDELIAPCVVINISEKANETYQCSIKDIDAHEHKYGKIQKKSCVLIHTGWDAHWCNPTKYRNNLQFPSVTNEAALMLLDRDIVGLGIDTLSPDTEQSGFPVHHTLLQANRYIIENVANSKKLPAVGSFIVGLPLPIVDGTEAPLRLIALVPKV